MAELRLKEPASPRTLLLGRSDCDIAFSIALWSYLPVFWEKQRRDELQLEVNKCLAPSFLFLLGLLPVVAYGDGYICEADMATGFSYKSGTWSPANFEPNRKFVVRRTEQSEQSAAHVPEAKWSVLVLGDKAS